MRVASRCALTHVHARPSGWNADWAQPAPSPEPTQRPPLPNLPHLGDQLHCGVSKTSRTDGTMPLMLGVDCWGPGRGLAVAPPQHVYLQLVQLSPAPGER